MPIEKGDPNFVHPWNYVYREIEVFKLPDRDDVSVAIVTFDDSATGRQAVNTLHSSIINSRQIQLKIIQQVLLLSLVFINNFKACGKL